MVSGDKPPPNPQLWCSDGPPTNHGVRSVWVRSFPRPNGIHFLYPVGKAFDLYISGWKAEGILIYIEHRYIYLDHTAESVRKVFVYPVVFSLLYSCLWPWFQCTSCDVTSPFFRGEFLFSFSRLSSNVCLLFLFFSTDFFLCIFTFQSSQVHPGFSWWHRRNVEKEAHAISVCG